MKKLFLWTSMITLILCFFAACSEQENAATEHRDSAEYTLKYTDAASFEAALNSGEKVKGMIVQFIANDYKPDSALGFNCWAGEHLNFISENNLNISAGDTIIGKVTKEPSKVLFYSWKIPYEVLSIHKSEKTWLDSRTPKNGFDSATNETYTLASYTVELPKYWKFDCTISGGNRYFAETGGKVAMLQFTAQAESDDNYPVTFDGLMNDNENMIKMLETTMFQDVTDYEVIDTGVVKGILYKGTITEEKTGLSGYGEWFAFASEDNRTWCSLVMCQTNNTTHLYTSDFMRIIQSIKYKEHESESQPVAEVPSTEITLTMSEEDFKGLNYKEAEKAFREMGFTAFEYETVTTEDKAKDNTICYIEIVEFIFGDSSFTKGDKFAADSTITFYFYKHKEPKTPDSVFYSTNDCETAKKGNTGVFSYKDQGNSYDIYWIIDFDEGYVYYFIDGNGDSFCDRLKIDSGTLNDAVTITYHDGNDVWSYALHFKYVNHPENLIMVDQNGFDYKYSTTDLNDALAIKNTKTIKDY